MFIWTNEKDIKSKLDEIGYLYHSIPTGLKPGVPFQMVYDENTTETDPIKKSIEDSYYKFKYLSIDDVCKIGNTINSYEYKGDIFWYLINYPTSPELRKFQELYQVLNAYDCTTFLNYVPNSGFIHHHITVKNEQQSNLSVIDPIKYDEVNKKLNVMTEMYQSGTLITKDTIINMHGLTFTLGEYNQAAYSYSEVGIANLRFIKDTIIKVNYNGDVVFCHTDKNEDFLMGERICNIIEISNMSVLEIDDKYNISNFLNGSLDSEVLDDDKIGLITNSILKTDNLKLSTQDKTKIVQYVLHENVYTIPFIRALTLKSIMIGSTIQGFKTVIDNSRSMTKSFQTQMAYRNSLHNVLRDLK